jgi:WD40 repeat protein/mono/diheme cytochrome c family protein
MTRRSAQLRFPSICEIALSRYPRYYAFALTLAVGGATTAVAARQPQQAPDFARDVLPVFESNCLRCHSAAAQKGDLILDTHEDIVAGGRHGAAIVVGNAEKSPLVGMMEGRVEPRMPPKSVMRPEDIAIVRAWIDAGAKPSPGAALTLEDRVPRITPAHGLSPAVHSLAWSVDGRTLLVPGYRDVRRVDVASAAAPAGAPISRTATRAPVESATSRLRRTRPLGGAIDLVRGVARSADGWWFAGAGGIPGAAGEVIVWDADTGDEAFTLRGHRDYVYDAAFNHRSTRLATCSYDRTVRIWDLDTGRAIRVLREHTEAIYAVAFSADDNWLASGAGDRSVKLWDVRSGKRMVTLTDPVDVVSTLDFDPRELRLSAAGADKTIRTWTFAVAREPGAANGSGGGVRVTPTLVSSTLAHSAPILRIAYAPDGKRLASAASDGIVKIWDTDRWTEVRTLERQPDWAQGLAWSPDGARLAIGRFDGSVAIYDVRSGRRVADPIRGPKTKAATTEAMRPRGEKPAADAQR